MWNLAPLLQIVQKIPENCCYCLYLSTGQVWWLNGLWFKRYIQKMHPISCTNTHHDITDLVSHGISWEWNITFLWNKKILNLCIRWHILRSYHFVAEVTFKEKSYLKMLGLSFSAKWDWFSVALSLKLPLSNLEHWFVLLSFFILRLLLYHYKSTTQPWLSHLSWCS